MDDLANLDQVRDEQSRLTLEQSFNAVWAAALQYLFNSFSSLEESKLTDLKNLIIAGFTQPNMTRILYQLPTWQAIFSDNDSDSQV